MCEKNLSFFENGIQMLRSKILCMHDIEKKMKLLAVVGVASRDMRDFELLFNNDDLTRLYEKRRIEKVRGSLKEHYCECKDEENLKILVENAVIAEKERMTGFAARKLAEAGFFRDARMMRDRLIDPETAFEASLFIASESKDATDFRKADEIIDDIAEKTFPFDSDGRKSSNSVKRAREKLVEELARAGKYRWATQKAREIKSGEFLNGKIARLITNGAYTNKPPEYVLRENITGDLELAFNCAMESAELDMAIISIILLLRAGKADIGRKLAERIKDGQYGGRYVKAKSFLLIALETQKKEDVEKAYKFSLACKNDERDEHYFNVLCDVAKFGRNPYFLGLAIGEALKEDNPSWRIQTICGILSEVKNSPAE